MDYPSLALRQVKTIADNYQDRVLKEYVKLGIMVRVDSLKQDVAKVLAKQSAKRA